MNKTMLFAAAVLLLTACKKDQTEVKSQDTVIEGKQDTIMVDTDTVTQTTELPDETEPEKSTEQPEKVEKPEVKAKEVAVKSNYASFGDKIVADNAISKEQMYAKYKSLKPGDSVSVKFTTNINNVCQKKGCWMTLQLPEGKESFVKFKDYAFFVPLNAPGQDAIVSGKAFVSETSVAQLRHYAKDEGKSEADIAKITEPEKTYGFLADGVLISK